MKHMFSAGIIPYSKKNEIIFYLLLQYSSGHWEFPKGKIEEGEAKIEAAERELLEETGLTAHIDPEFEETITYIFTDYDKQLARKTVYFFIGEVVEEKVQLSYEHIDYAWLEYNQALDRLTYKNAKVILEKAHLFISKN